MCLEKSSRLKTVHKDLFLLLIKLTNQTTSSVFQFLYLKLAIHSYM